MRTVAYLSDDHMIEWLIMSARKDPASLVGERFSFSDKAKAREAQKTLAEAGYTAYQKRQEVIIVDYLPPATRDSDGFFIADDALAARIRRELEQFNTHRPTEHTDKSLPPSEQELSSTLLLTEQQRGDNEDVVGFIRGREDNPRYQDGYLYLQSDVLWYSNFGQCLKVVIPDFDEYGMNYYISRTQWKEIRRIAGEHGRYASGIAETLDRWLHDTDPDSGVDRTADDDIAMTIMCI